MRNLYVYMLKQCQKHDFDQPPVTDEDRNRNDNEIANDGSVVQGRQTR